MPTLEHNGFVDMFRENPSLAPHLLAKLFHVDIPHYTSVAVVESSLDQLMPVEFRADLVLELRDENGALVLAIVLEVQRDKDPDKKYAWPVYVVTVRAKKRCPACVLVVSTDSEVAAWAGEAIALGPGGTIAPLVLGPSVVPVITDQAEAKQESELAILSAVVHGNGPNGLTVVEAALSALGKFDAEHAAVYFQLVYDALREPLRRAVEALIMERQSEAKARLPQFMQELIEKGVREGLHEGELKGLREGELKGLREGELKGLREGELKGLREGELKGLREGELKGLREGELKGKRDMLLRLVTRAGIALAEDDRARILACTDPAVLEQWVENVLGAKTAADVLS